VPTGETWKEKLDGHMVPPVKRSRCAEKNEPHEGKAGHFLRPDDGTFEDVPEEHPQKNVPHVDHEEGTREPCAGPFERPSQSGDAAESAGRVFFGRKGRNGRGRPFLTVLPHGKCSFRHGH
jgi:hypothetical protein